MRTLGVEEELLVVSPDGRPVPLGPEALRVAAERGQGVALCAYEYDGVGHTADVATPSPTGAARSTRSRPFFFAR